MKSLKMLPMFISEIAQGKKTQTRRLITPQPHLQGITHIWKMNNYPIAKINEQYPIFIDILKKAHYKTGDKVKVINSYTGENSETIEITHVKIEKILDITNEDLISEGLKKIDRVIQDENGNVSTKGHYWFNYIYDKFDKHTPIESWKTLVQLIYGSTAILNNPYCYVYEFKRL